ncbi:Serine/threonine-protein phosphatase 4 regulatory subunit 3 [Armadillidium nasatum]|uniref:Serine/threonine-protein phosphatase 4 regulatory subunit 3 n=1 Tax=Armadillidium nasatum TaxID=96803 RepID=A0A5N5SQN6_9CRUS|nr:Serine/threonine-protein phosphatase 4 regulatory subunit 3 [Armadillidium nasatum]
MTDRMARRRVKLYALNAERQWDDRGTGHVTSAYVERLKGMSLLVRAESDGSLLLESKILPDTAYQKQQGTLIVWSEGENFDLALSFQEKAGCDEIWEKICQVQGKDPSVEITQDIIEESEDERYEDVNEANPWVELPPCEISRLESINEVISNCLHSPVRREKLAIALENEGYIKKLISLFNMCEDLENMEGLHLLYEIFKNIFLLNKNALFEIMFADDMIFDVVGALEYDPSSPYPKKHRQFLKSRVKFKEVIPIENNELLSKIHQTYRVQYIQDVVLPTPAVFEENMLSTLSSFVFFNKVEIVSLIQEDERFLSELFHQLSSSEDEVPLQKRKDLVLFLKEFCTFSQTLQPINRETFFKTLSNMGVLSALEITLSLDNQVIKSASIDILSYIVEFSPSMVREYMMQQQHKVEEEQYLLNIIIEQMVLDSDPEMGGAVQLMGILRILIDPENMMATVTKSERTDFLVFFYKHSMHSLVAPLLSNTVGNEVGREDYQTAQLLALILELLAFCVEHHTYHIKNYIVQRDLLNRILVLMKSKHTFLVLSALRFMRKIVGLKDDFYNRHIVNSNLFAPVVDAFVRNNGRYNLLDSAILEMFEYIRVEDIKTLYLNIVEKFGSILSKVEYVQTFSALCMRYEQHQERKEKPNAALDNLTGVVRGNAMGLTSPGVGRFRRDVRDMDPDEELWFNNEEEDIEENESIPVLQQNNRDAPTSPPLPVVEKIEKEMIPVTKPLSPKPSLHLNNNKDNNNTDLCENPKSPSLTCKKVSLVDYDENSDEEEEEEEEEELSNTTTKCTSATSAATTTTTTTSSSSATTAEQSDPPPCLPSVEEDKRSKREEGEESREEVKSPPNSAKRPRLSAD